MTPRGLPAAVQAQDVERRAARGGAVTLAAQAFKMASAAAGTLYLTRELSPHDFGLVNMIIAATGIIDLLKDYGLSTATIQRPEITHEEVSALFWINVGIGAVLSLVTALAAPLLAMSYGRQELQVLTFGLASGTLLGALSVQHLALLKRTLQLERVAAIDVGSTLISTLAAVLAVMQGAGVWALVVRQLVRLGVQTVMSWMLCRWLPSLPVRTDVRSLVGFGTHISGFQVMNYLERNLDNVLVGRFVGAEALGFYSKAYEAMRLPLDQIGLPVGAAMLPALSRLGDSPDRYRSAYVGVTRVILLVVAALVPIAIFSADWLIPAVLGPRWAGSVRMFQWLTVGLLIKPLLNTTSWLFVSQGRGSELMRWGVVGGVIAIASFCIGLPWGALGVAIAYTLAEIVIRAPLLIWWCGRIGPVSVRDLLSCLWPGLTFAAIVTVVYATAEHALLQQTPGLRVAICAPLSLVLGAGVFALTRFGRESLRSGITIIRMLRSGGAPR